MVKIKPKTKRVTIRFDATAEQRAALVDAWINDKPLTIDIDKVDFAVDLTYVKESES